MCVLCGSGVPGWTILTPEQFRRSYLAGSLRTFHAVFSYSSVEHSGLGRYGDTLNPWGDLMAVAEAWCVAGPGARLALAVPQTGAGAGAGRCGPTCTGSTPPRAWRAWPPTGGSPGGLAPTPCGLRTRATTSSTATSRFMSSTKFPVCNKNYKIKSIDLNESNTNTLSRGI